MRVGLCPKCRGDMIVPTFSEDPQPPTCENSCDLVEGELETVEDLFASDSSHTLAVRLSSNVGGYQSALLDGDKGAAKAFLANVVALGELLMKRLDQ